MKISDIENYIKEDASDNTNRVIRAALMSIKMHGVPTVKVSQVLRDFASRGITISIPELINILQNDPMISDISADTITFASDMPNVTPRSGADKEIEDKATISSMAKQALKKRGL